MIQICVWGCPDLHSIDVIGFVALKPLLLAAAEILLLFWHVVLFRLSFYTNRGDVLPPVSNSERTVSPHCLWGGYGCSSCWSIPPCHLMGSAIAASLPGTKHHPSPSPASLLVGSWGGMVGGSGAPLAAGHMLQWESFLNWACVHSHASTISSFICICLLSWDKNVRVLEKPWFWGAGENSAVSFSGCSEMSKSTSFNLQSKPVLGLNLR